MSFLFAGSRSQGLVPELLAQERSSQAREVGRWARGGGWGWGGGDGSVGGVRVS